MVKIIQEPLEGLKLIQLDIYDDERGFFVERFTKSKFEAAGLPGNFVQDNFSYSKAGVIRGLHYQRSPDQAKLVSCTKGTILDVAVDIRKDSDSYGKYFAVELTGKNGLSLYIPAGFAHGFCALEEADVIYKVDGYYNAAGEGGIIYNDADIAIKWPVKAAIVSGKDMKLQSFAAYKNNPVF